MRLKIDRRAFLVGTALLASEMRGVAAQPASAPYPSRPVKLVVPSAAGSGVDFVGRILAEELQAELRAPFVVENRAGANGTIAADSVAKAPADGYTLFVGGTSTNASAPSLYKNLPYDVERDFEPIANVVASEFLLVVRGDSPIRSVKDLKDWVAANKGKASFGYGTATTQIAGAAFTKRMALPAVGVPYKSNPHAMTDLMGGLVTFMFIDQTTALPQIKAGKLRALAVASPRRMAALPDVPTLAEAGLADFLILTFVALFAPAGLPAPVAEHLTGAMARIMTKRSVRDKLAPSGEPMPPLSRSALQEFLRGERQSWAAKAREADIRPE